MHEHRAGMTISFISIIFQCGLLFHKQLSEHYTSLWVHTANVGGSGVWPGRPLCLTLAKNTQHMIHPSKGWWFKGTEEFLLYLLWGTIWLRVLPSINHVHLSVISEEVCTLVITEAFPEDSGIFQCVAENEFGAAASSACLFISQGKYTHSGHKGVKPLEGPISTQCQTVINTKGSSKCLFRLSPALETREAATSSPYLIRTNIGGFLLTVGNTQEDWEYFRKLVHIR